MIKAAPRVMRYANANFQPRSEYGDQAQAAHLIGDADGSELGAGLVRLSNARIPWTVQYDEVVLVLEGTFTARTQEDVLTAGPWDSIWLSAGTKLTYEAEEALLLYAIHRQIGQRRPRSCALLDCPKTMPQTRGTRSCLLARRIPGLLVTSLRTGW